MSIIKSILEKISSPADLRPLNSGELDILAAELRSEIIDSVSRNGGHLAPNLGTVELTIALLRCFELPADQIIWDVGHQSYSYKLLTGRQKEFKNLRRYHGCCGFPVRGENQFDSYGAGHAGVAISAALGMCAAQTPEDQRKVIAVIGDGAIGSGVALEGLNQVRDHGKNLVIVLNDNKMAISENVGSISRALNRMMTSFRYRWIKNCAKTLINLLPRSQKITHYVSRIEDAAKSLLLPGGIFGELGIRYLGPINGHDIAALERTFNSIRNDSRPVLIHVVTQKGRGYAPAETSPERFHGVSAFDPASGEPLKKSPPGFSAAFGQAVCDLAGKMPELTAVVAAMTGGVGLEKFARSYPDRFYDAGMAEGHAVTFSSGLAASGKKVICAIYATFMQRSLDNIFHDVCLMKLPVVFALDRAGLVEDGPTHHGIYDLGFLLGMPNLTIMQPGCEAEVKPMIEFALALNSPVVIRYPRGCSRAAAHPELPEIAPVKMGCSTVWRPGEDLAIHAVGAEAVRALDIADILQKEYALSAKVVNVRFLKPFDHAALLSDAEKMPVFTLEDHIAATGLGAVASRSLTSGSNAFQYKPLTILGIPENPLPTFGAVDSLRREMHLDTEALAGKIARIMEQYRSNSQ